MSKIIGESENLFRMMANATDAFIWKLEPDGETVFYNNSLQNFLGITSENQQIDWSTIVHPEDALTTLTKIRSAIATRHPFILECRLRRTDGAWRWIEAKGNPMLDSKNIFMGYIGTSTDITESKTKTDLINESESKLEFAIEAAELCYWDYNPLTQKFNANKRLRDWYGVDDETDIDFEIGFNAIAEADREHVLAALQKALTWGEGDYNIQYNLVNIKTGKKRIVSAKGKATFGEDKNASRFVGILQDITEQARAQQELKESEQKFQNLIRETSVAIIVVIGKEMIVEIVNSAYGDLINLTPADLLGKPLYSIVPEAEAHYRPQLEEVLYTGVTTKVYDSPYAVTINGELIEGFLDIIHQPYRNNQGQILGVISTIQNVTVSVLARKKLEQSEKKFEAAIAAVEGVIWTNNAVGEMEGDQPGWSSLTGQTYEEYRGYGWAKAVHPDDAQPTVDAWNDAVAQKKIFEFEHRVNTKDKGWRTFCIKAVPSFNVDGNLEQWVGVHTDITEQKETVLQLKESEEQFTTLAENVQNLAWMADKTGSIYWYNKRWFEYTGTTLEDMQGWGWAKVHHPDYVDDVVSFVKKAWEVNEPWTLTFPLKGVDGNYRWFLTRATPINDANGNIVRWIGTNTDIEEQKSFAEKLEAEVNERTWQLHKANNGLKEKNIELAKINAELESFTYVASHDLQEPLRKIQTYASALKENDSSALSDTGKNYLDRMTQAAARMRALIKDLLSFSSLNFSEVTFENKNLQDSVTEMIEEFDAVIKEMNARIEWEGNIETVRVIPFQFKQLLQNLIGNALKFTKKGMPPHIVIKSDRAKASMTPQLLPSIIYTHISISDNGIGIQPEYMDRIFELFKRLHHSHEYAGTGIGLSIVKKVVENHRGIITVDSVYGKGTTFNIFIPAYKNIGS